MTISRRFTAAFLAAGLAFLGTAHTSRADIGVGDSPSFEVTAFDGTELSLEQFKGKLVLVDFWATWCGPCMAEAAHMVEVHKKYGEKGLQIVGISLDNDRIALKNVIADKAFTWPQFYDGKGWGNELAKAWGVRSIPATFLIDPSGKVVWKGHPAQMDAAIEKAFRETPPDLLDKATVSKVKAALDFIDANHEADTVAAWKKLGEIPAFVKKDEGLAARLTAAQAKLDAAGDKLMADVETQIADKQYAAAIKQLRIVAARLEKQALGVRAQKRLDSLLAEPGVKTQIKEIELDTRANEMLALAVKYKGDDKEEQAYLAYRQVVKQFPKTDAAKTAAAEVAEYERDPAFVRRALDIEAGDRAKSLMSLADNYKAMKKYDQARAKYQQVVDEFPGTTYAQRAKTELSGM